MSAAPARGGEETEGRFGALRGTLAAARNILDWSGRIIAVACLSAMFLALLANVVLRYLFGTGIPWAYEIHAILLPWLVGGGLVIAAAHDRNIAVTLLPDMLGRKARWVLLLLIHAAVLVIALSVLWSSGPIIKASHYQRLSTFGVTQFWGYLSLVYAFVGMALLALIDILHLLSGDRDALEHLGASSLS